MANTNISRKITKLIKKHEAIKKSAKKPNSESYLAEFKQKLQINFYNPKMVPQIVEDDESIFHDQDDRAVFENPTMEIWEDLEDQNIDMEDQNIDMEDQNNDMEDANDPIWLPENHSVTKELPTTSTGAETFVKNAIRCPEVTQACMSTGTTPATFMVLTTAMNFANNVVSQGNAVETIRNHQNQHRPIIANEIISKTKRDLADSVVFMQWDEKCLSNVTQEDNEKNHVERLAIVASNENGNRLLAIEKLKSGTGRNIAASLFNISKSFDIINLIMGIVFDTTSSNTGIENGAGILFQEMLGRYLLFLACRHHVLEVYLRTCFESIFGASGKFFYTYFRHFYRRLRSRFYLRVLKNVTFFN